MTVAFIGLGSNMGDRFFNLFSAAGLLIKECGLRKASSVYKTAPVGYKDQEDFFNCVLEVNTDMTPSELLNFLKSTERCVGREPSFKNGPRLIDLDLLLYDDEVIDTEGLAIPHPRMHERGFVLVPMQEIAPEIVHPVLHKTMQQLLEELKDSGDVEKWGKMMLRT